MGRMLPGGAGSSAKRDPAETNQCLLGVNTAHSVSLETYLRGQKVASLPTVGKEIRVTAPFGTSAFERCGLCLDHPVLT